MAVESAVSSATVSPFAEMNATLALHADSMADACDGPNISNVFDTPCAAGPIPSSASSIVSTAPLSSVPPALIDTRVILPRALDEPPSIPSSFASETPLPQRRPGLRATPPSTFASATVASKRSAPAARARKSRALSDADEGEALATPNATCSDPSRHAQVVGKSDGARMRTPAALPHEPRALRSSSKLLPSPKVVATPPVLTARDVATYLSSQSSKRPWVDEHLWQFVANAYFAPLQVRDVHFVQAAAVAAVDASSDAAECSPAVACSSSLHRIAAGLETAADADNMGSSAGAAVPAPSPSTPGGGRAGARSARQGSGSFADAACLATSSSGGVVASANGCVSGVAAAGGAEAGGSAVCGDDASVLACMLDGWGPSAHVDSVLKDVEDQVHALCALNAARLCTLAAKTRAEFGAQQIMRHLSVQDPGAAPEDEAGARSIMDNVKRTVCGQPAFERALAACDAASAPSVAPSLPDDVVLASAPPECLDALPCDTDGLPLVCAGTAHAARELARVRAGALEAYAPPTALYESFPRYQPAAAFDVQTASVTERLENAYWAIAGPWACLPFSHHFLNQASNKVTWRWPAHDAEDAAVREVRGTRWRSDARGLPSSDVGYAYSPLASACAHYPAAKPVLMRDDPLALNSPLPHSVSPPRARRGRASAGRDVSSPLTDARVPAAGTVCASTSRGREPEAPSAPLHAHASAHVGAHAQPQAHGVIVMQSRAERLTSRPPPASTGFLLPPPPPSATMGAVADVRLWAAAQLQAATEAGRVYERGVALAALRGRRIDNVPDMLCTDQLPPPPPLLQQCSSGGSTVPCLLGASLSDGGLSIADDEGSSDCAAAATASTRARNVPGRKRRRQQQRQSRASTRTRLAPSIVADDVPGSVASKRQRCEDDENDEITAAAAAATATAAATAAAEATTTTMTESVESDADSCADASGADGSGDDATPSSKKTRRGKKARGGKKAAIRKRQRSAGVDAEAAQVAMEGGDGDVEAEAEAEAREELKRIGNIAQRPIPYAYVSAPTLLPNIDARLLCWTPSVGDTARAAAAAAAAPLNTAQTDDAVLCASAADGCGAGAAAGLGDEWHDAAAADSCASSDEEECDALVCEEEGAVHTSSAAAAAAATRKRVRAYARRTDPAVAWSTRRGRRGGVDASKRRRVEHLIQLAVRASRLVFTPRMMLQSASAGVAHGAQWLHPVADALRRLHEEMRTMETLLARREGALDADWFSRCVPLGTVVDACDVNDNWCVAVVVAEVRDAGVLRRSLRLHFADWSTAADEWIDVADARLAPVGMHTLGARRQVAAHPIAALTGDALLL